METLTADRVIVRGGWHPRYARVLLIEQVGREALVLVDGNGDGAEVEAERWFVDETGWVAGGSNGIGSTVGRSLWTWTDIGGSGLVVGGAEPGTTVVVEWGGEVRSALTQPNGVWTARFSKHPARPSALDLVGEARGSSQVSTLSAKQRQVLRAARPRVVTPVAGSTYPCPCCRYLTLTERGTYELCPVCFWEDDGQDDPHADEVWGGPNGRLSLAAAR